MNFCQNCQHWHRITAEGFDKKFGQCDNPVVETRIAVQNKEDMIDELFEDMRGIFTDEFFGCIYFEKENQGVVTKL